MAIDIRNPAEFEEIVTERQFVDPTQLTGRSVGSATRNRSLAQVGRPSAVCHPPTSRLAPPIGVYHYLSRIRGRVLSLEDNNAVQKVRPIESLVGVVKERSRTNLHRCQLSRADIDGARGTSFQTLSFH